MKNIILASCCLLCICASIQPLQGQVVLKIENIDSIRASSGFLFGLKTYLFPLNSDDLFSCISESFYKSSESNSPVSIGSKIFLNGNRTFAQPNLIAGLRIADQRIFILYNCDIMIVDFVNLPVQVPGNHFFSVNFKPGYFHLDFSKFTGDEAG